MSKVRIPINPMQVGRVGAYSMYVSDGRQIVRQRQNSSNYGESARRSEAQQSRRVRWANLVNNYKEISDWMPKAFESKKAGQTDYNIFMQLNVNNTSVALTKDQALNGCAVIDAFQVSRGSLPTVQLSAGTASETVKSSIVITSPISGNTTIGQLSKDILDNNPDWKNGDNLALPYWSQFVDAQNYPYVSCGYQELTLDVDSAVLISSLDIFRFLYASATDFLTFALPGSSFGEYVGLAAIHTRKGSSLLVSSQSVYMTKNTYVQRFSTDAQVSAAIASYGLDTDVVLAPGSEAPARAGGSVIYPTLDVNLPANVSGDAVTMILPKSPAQLGWAKGDTVGRMVVNGAPLDIKWDDNTDYTSLGWLDIDMGDNVIEFKEIESLDTRALLAYFPANSGTLSSVEFFQI